MAETYQSFGQGAGPFGKGAKVRVSPLGRAACLSRFGSAVAWIGQRKEIRTGEIGNYDVSDVTIDDARDVAILVRHDGFDSLSFADGTITECWRVRRSSWIYAVAALPDGRYAALRDDALVLLAPQRAGAFQEIAACAIPVGAPKANGTPPSVLACLGGRVLVALNASRNKIFAIGVDGDALALLATLKQDVQVFETTADGRVFVVDRLNGVFELTHMEAVWSSTFGGSRDRSSLAIQARSGLGTSA